MSDFGRTVHQRKSATIPHPSKNKPQHPGLRLRSPAKYDFTVWLFTWGRPRHFRELMLRPAKLKAGERVLDVSCGTGSLALLAKEQVDPDGEVHGIDASEEMIAFAREKSKRAGADVTFEVAAAQKLPFDDASFDVVVNTLALHHLPTSARYAAFAEMRRVLKPGGRALVVDFAESEKRSKGLFGRLKHRHGSVPPQEIVDALAATGLRAIGSGPLGERSLHFVLAVPQSAEGDSTETGLVTAADDSRASSFLFRPYILAVAIAAVVLLHLGVLGAAARTISKAGRFGWTGAAVIVGALLIGKFLGLSPHSLALRAGVMRLRRNSSERHS